MTQTLTINLLAVIFAYLLGSVSTAIIVCKLFRLPDPRTTGSKNPGATNVFRTGGKLAAGLTFLGDFLKGFIPVYLAIWYKLDPFWVPLVALAAFIGHLYPVFFNFKGGKGVATGFGAILALSPLTGVCMLATWLASLLIFRYVSLAGIITAIAAPFYTYHFSKTTLADYSTVAIVAIMGLLLIYRHRSNIKNLLGHKELTIDSEDKD